MNTLEPQVHSALTAMARGESPLAGLCIQSSQGGGMWPADSLTYQEGVLHWEQRRPRGEGTLEADTPIPDDKIRAVLGLILEGEIWQAKKPGLPVLRPDSTVVSISVALQGVGAFRVSGEANDMRHGYPPFWTALEAFHAVTRPPPMRPPGPPTPV